MLKSVMNPSIVSFYVRFNYVSTLVTCIVALIGKLTYMSLMSRVMSLNFFFLIVSGMIFCATCVQLSVVYVLGICKIFMIFSKGILLFSTYVLVCY